MYTMGVWALALFFAVAAAAFAVGRWLGERTGRRRAGDEVPLWLRQEALRSGRCPVCDHAYGTMTDRAYADR
jgi:hypothetical protein